MGRGTPGGKDRQTWLRGHTQRQETQDRGSRREGSAGRLLCRHTGVFSQTTEREERGGQEKEEPEMQRLSLGYCLL